MFKLSYSFLPFSLFFSFLFTLIFNNSPVFFLFFPYFRPISLFSLFYLFIISPHFSLYSPIFPLFFPIFFSILPDMLNNFSFFPPLFSLFFSYPSPFSSFLCFFSFSPFFPFLLFPGSGIMQYWVIGICTPELISSNSICVFLLNI